MFPRNPMILVDKQVLNATEVLAIVVKSTLGQIDAAEITVAASLQALPTMYRLDANLEVKLTLGDSIFSGRIVSMAPRAGFRELVIHAHGKMRLLPRPSENDVRIVQPIKNLTLTVSSPPEGGAKDKRLIRAKLTLDPEFDSVKFMLGDTKNVSAGPGRSFTGTIENIERLYGKFGGDQMTLDVAGWMYESSTR